MRGLKLTLSYDGTRYGGWQAQKSKKKTLQGVLEAAWLRITGETRRAVASGRTDAGVHALGQVVSLCTENTLSTDILKRALNSELPNDMAVLEIVEVEPTFHAIRAAKRKRYRYVIHCSRLRDVFSLAHAWQVYSPLDVEAMNRAAQLLVGLHDFTSFRTTSSDGCRTSTRTVYELSVVRCTGDQSNFIYTEIEANGFLYNMVRTIVGVLVEVGRGRRAESWPAEVLAAKDRRAAGLTAPAQGLFLVKVDY
jgi:tRNA pseudouridine38-40 synthase